MAQRGNISADQIRGIPAISGSLTSGNLIKSDVDGHFVDAGVTTDTDGTLAANSDSKIATQKAVKTYVDAHSGSGGFYPTFTVPATADFTWTNQLSTVVTAYANRLKFALPTNASDPNWRLYRYTAAALPTKWRVEVAFAFNTIGSPSYTDWGIFIRNTSSGKFVFFGADTGASGGLRKITFNSVTSVSGITTIGILAGPPLGFFAIQWDGANRTYEYSSNGWDWTVVVTEANNTTFITPDEWGLGFANFYSATQIVTAFHGTMITLP